MQNYDNSLLSSSIKNNEKLLTLIVFLFGILSLVVGIFVPVGSKGSTVLLGIGCSLISSSMVSYLNAKYAVRDAAYATVIDKWGLCAIYSSRQEMNISCDRALQAASKHIEMVGFGFRSLRDSQDALMKEKAKMGVHIRIISMNPNSQFLVQREKDELVAPGSIKETILQFNDWISELRSLAPKSENIQVKYYDSLPQDFYFRVDDHVFVGPYEYGKQSQQTISYEYKGKSEGFKYYTNYFDKLWNNNDFCAPLN